MDFMVFDWLFPRVSPVQFYLAGGDESAGSFCGKSERESIGILRPFRFPIRSEQRHGRDILVVVAIVSILVFIDPGFSHPKLMVFLRISLSPLER
jgi:hypothetical protein